MHSRVVTGSCRARWTAVVWTLVVVGLAQAAPPAKPAPESPPSRPTDGSGTIESPAREQSIYIPYTKLREVFEREGRGVFLPYGEFEKLWRAAREKTGPMTEVQPPVPFLISEVANEATAAKEVVNVRAQIKIELLGTGWHRIPLGLANAAVTRAMIGDQPARIVFDPQTGHQLLIEKTGNAAETLTLVLEYAKAFEKAAGRNTVSFQPPRAPVSRWHIQIPESGAKVTITPLIAATQVPANSATTQPSEVTEVLAFVGAAPNVEIAWTPKAEGATGLATLATVQTEQQVRIEDGAIRTRVQLAYEISRAALAELVVEVPGDQRVTRVLDANVRQWSVVQPTTSAPSGEGRQRIAIQLFEPARVKQSVVIELERFLSEAEQRKLQTPVVSAIGVGRQQGIVVVAVAEGLRAEMTAHTGLQQVDASELPKSLTDWKWLLAYRYAALPFDLTMQVEKIQPRVVADSLVEASLEPEQLSLDMLTVYTIERAGVFRFEYDVPAGYEVRQVAGRAIGKAQPTQVDTHYLDGPDKTHLVINLASKALGQAALGIKMQRRLTGSDLRSPTGRSVSIPLSIPRVAPTTVERATGRLMIHATESLRVNPGQAQGLRSVSFKEALDGMESVRDKGAVAFRPVLAFTFGQENATLALAVERRKPQITVRQLLLAQIEAGVIKYSATFTYDIQYSGVPSLRIDVPADLAPDIRNNTPGIREKTIDPPPAEVAQGCVAWGFVGETELNGNVQVRLSWEKKIEELAVGKTIELPLPHLKPQQVDRAWGQIVWTKVETLDVQESGEPKGIRPIDPQHDLMPNTSISGAARAFEFHDDWSLRLAITRYKLQEVKGTSIERAVLQMVSTRSNQTSVRALYRLRSAGQRLALKLPGNVEFDNEPLRINGRAVALERGEQDEFFVPLVGLNTDTPFLMELRYSIPQDRRQFTPPAFPAEPATQKVYLCAYLPEELAYLGSRGPWTDEMDFRWAPVMDLTPVAHQSGDQLLDWVREGLNVANTTADTFQTDGRLYVFSTLRPTATGSGSLWITAMDENWLSAIVFIMVVVLGAALMRFAVATRWLAGGVFFVLLILSGVFVPTFSQQVLDGKMLAAVTIVLILWALQYVIWIRPRDPVIIARKAALLARAQAPLSSARVVEPAPADAQSDKSQGGESHV